MMIMDKFKDKMIRSFGDKGRDWIEKLPGIIEACIEKWKLTECVPSNCLSYNYICFVKSREFGDAVLKIGLDSRELFAEIKALDAYKGRNICRCFDYDLELGAFIMERLIPGADLTSIVDVSKRIDIAADLISLLPARVEKEEEFPSYAAWIKRAFDCARRENRVGDKMLQFINRAEEYFIEINSSVVPKVLLHGDLHHFNILQNSDGNWKAIDPKGVIGLPYFECMAFMENQLNMLPDEEKNRCLKDMVAVFSGRFNESEITIGKAFFTNTVLRTCWTFEENPSPEEAAACVSLCEAAGRYVWHN